MLSKNTFRIANQSDYEIIKNLMLTALKEDPLAFSIEYLDALQASTQWWDKTIANYFESKNSLFLVQQSDNVVTGMVGYFSDTNLRSQHVATIVWFYVLKKYRGMGRGFELLSELIKIIKDKGDIRKIKLFVNSEQLNAINIYSKLGFKITGKFEKELSILNSLYDVYIMELFIE